jgi:hypothetical protein
MSIDDSIRSRGDVRTYTLIPRLLFRLIPGFMLKRMYAKAMIEAIGEYNSPGMGPSLDFNDIAVATVAIEKEIARRGLPRKPLNPSDEPKVYATDVWANVPCFWP